MRFLARLLISALVLFGVAYLSGGALLRFDSPQDAFFFAALLGLVNALVKPVVKFLTLPIRVLTLGLFSVVLNVLFFYGVASLIRGAHTMGVLQTVAAALLVSVATSLVCWVAGL